MSAKFRIEGMHEVLQNLKIFNMELKDRALVGLVKATVVVRRATELESPITPLKDGNLRASWTVVTAKGVPFGKNAIFTGKKSAELMRIHHTSIGDLEQEATATARNQIKVIMAYTANYAAIVHEMGYKYWPGTIKWSRPGSGARWFQLAVNNNQDNIKNAIRGEVKVDPSKIRTGKMRKIK